MKLVFFQVVDMDSETNVSSFLWENFMTTHAFGLNNSYTSRQYQGIYLMSPTYSVSAGLLYRLLDNKLSLSLNVNDLFVSHYKGEIFSNNLRMTVDNQFSFTSFRIGVSYTFGGDIRSKGERNSNKDIQRRL